MIALRSCGILARHRRSASSTNHAQRNPNLRSIWFQQAGRESTVEPQSALRSLGRSPNFRITVASPKLPVAGSPFRLKAIAPT
jgi:hypothetical protein